MRERQKARGGGSFVRQAAILAAASLFVRFIGFAYRIPLTALIGDVGNNLYISAYSVYAFAIVISSGALPSTVSRLVSERLAKREYHNAHELFKTALVFALFSGAAVGVLMWVGAEWILNLLGQPQEAITAVRALAPTLFFVAMLAVFRGYFQGMKTTVPTAISQVLEQVVNVVFTVVLASAFMQVAGLQHAVAGAAAGTGIGAIAGLAVVIIIYMFAVKLFKRRIARDHTPGESKIIQLSAIIKTAMPIALGMGIFQLTTLIDLSMLSGGMSNFFPDLEIQTLTGQFTGKYLLFITLPASLSLALSSAIIPEITSSAVKMEKAAVRHKTNTALRISMILSIPSAVGLAVLADPIIALLFPGHPEGGWLLRWGSVAIIFMALVNVLTGTLQGLGHTKMPMVAAFFGVLVKIPANFVLIGIPQINVLGAVISTILCYAVAAIINMYYLYKTSGVLPEVGGTFVKPALAAAGMGMVCYIVYFTINMFMPSAIATIAALLIGGLAYLLFMCALKGFKQSDLNAMPLPKRVKRWLK